MKTTVEEASKVAQAAETVGRLVGKTGPNGFYFSTHTIRTGLEAIKGDAENADYSELASALKTLCDFGVKLNKVEFSIK